MKNFFIFVLTLLLLVLLTLSTGWICWALTNQFCLSVLGHAAEWTVLHYAFVNANAFLAFIAIELYNNKS
jgi:hypothetical protein